MNKFQNCVYNTMIEINSLPSPTFDGQFYSIHYERLGFLLFPSPALSSLKHFNSTNQKTLGKMFVRFDLSWLLKGQHFFKEINYVLLSDYKQVLLLPYLLRMMPKANVMATSLTYQLARIALQTFQDTLADYDSTSSTLDFQTENQIIAHYEHQFQTNFDDWRRLYSKQQVENTLKRLIKVNYHQNYNTERGVQLRAFPSGKNNGSCCWQLFGTLAGQKILLVNQVSQYSWRTCRSLDLNRIKESHEQSPYSYVIFTKKALDTREGQEAKLAQTIKQINTNAENSISTTIVLEDDTLCVDLIPRLSTVPQGKLRGILLKQHSYHFFHNVINSYVDYLSDHYRNQIFCQNPDYPLAHYSKLKEKGLLVIGSLQEAAVKAKLPLRQIVSQCHPFVQFMTSYEYHLQSEQITSYFSNHKHVYQQLKLGSNFTSTMLSNFLAALPKARILGFCQGHANVQVLQLDKKYNFGPQRRLSYHITATNCSKNEYQKYSLANNQLFVQEAKLQVWKLPKNWPELMAKDLKVAGVQVSDVLRNTIKLKNSSVVITADYKVQILSSDPEELILIQKWFREKATRYLLA